MLLDVGPELLDALCAGRLLLAHDVGKLGAQLHGLGQPGALGHGGGGGEGLLVDEEEERELQDGNGE